MDGTTQEYHLQTEMTRDTDRTWEASLIFLMLLFSTKDCLHQLYLSMNPGKSLSSITRLKDFSLCMHKMGCVANSGPMNRTAENDISMLHILHSWLVEVCDEKRWNVKESNELIEHGEWNNITFQVQNQVSWAIFSSHSNALPNSTLNIPGKTCFWMYF